MNCWIQYLKTMLLENANCRNMIVFDKCFSFYILLLCSKPVVNQENDEDVIIWWHDWRGMPFLKFRLWSKFRDNIRQYNCRFSRDNNFYLEKTCPEIQLENKSFLCTQTHTHTHTYTHTHTHRPKLELIIKKI